MDPLAGRDRPCVGAAVVTFDAEKNFHPNKSGPAERLLPLRYSKLDGFPGLALECKFVLTGWSLLSARVECVARAADTDGIDFLCIDGRPISQPITRLPLQRLQRCL